jgi:hypothetical protein
MLDRSYIVRLYSIESGEELPLNAYLTSRTFYQKFVKDAQFEINGQVQYLVDSVEDDKDTGILVFEGDKVFYTGKDDRKLVPITVHTGYVSTFDPETFYDHLDVIWYAGDLYSRKAPGGKGIWRAEEWIRVESGHQIPALSVYDSFNLDAELFNLKYGVFFYGDRLEFAAEPYDPILEEMPEEKPEIIKDTTAFYNGMVMHNDLRWFDDL